MGFSSRRAHAIREGLYLGTAAAFHPTSMGRGLRMPDAFRRCAPGSAGGSVLPLQEDGWASTDVFPGWISGSMILHQNGFVSEVEASREGGAMG